MIIQPDHLAWIERVTAENMSYLRNALKKEKETSNHSNNLANKTVYNSKMNSSIKNKQEHLYSNLAHANEINDLNLQNLNLKNLNLNSLNHNLDVDHNITDKNLKLKVRDLDFSNNNKIKENNFLDDLAKELPQEGFYYEKRKRNGAKSVASSKQNSKSFQKSFITKKSMAQSPEPNKLLLEDKNKNEGDNAEGKYKLPKIKAFSMKKQILIKTILKEAKILNSIEIEELLRKMHETINKSDIRKDYGINLLTPANLKKFEESLIEKRRNQEEFEKIEKLEKIGKIDNIEKISNIKSIDILSASEVKCMSCTSKVSNFEKALIDSELGKLHEKKIKLLNEIKKYKELMSNP